MKRNPEFFKNKSNFPSEKETEKEPNDSFIVSSMETLNEQIITVNNTMKIINDDLTETKKVINNQYSLIQSLEKRIETLERKSTSPLQYTLGIQSEKANRSLKPLHKN